MSRVAGFQVPSSPESASPRLVEEPALPAHPASEAPSLAVDGGGPLLDVLGRVRLRHGWLCLDGTPVVPPPRRPGEMPLARRRLAQVLYSRWFAAWSPPPVPLAWFSNRQFFASLRAAHAAANSYEPGWMALDATPASAVLALRAGETRHVGPGEYVNLRRPGAAVKRGDAIAIAARRDTPAPRDGWWMTWSAAGPAPEHEALRLYWNCGPDAIQRLIHGLTRALGNARIPYTLKCPSAPFLFGRRDGTVLYIARRDWPAVRHPLRLVHRALSRLLDEHTPPMTFRLGRGAALAEDPGNGWSYGQTISDAVASGILEGFGARDADLESRVTLLRQSLRDRGISPERPYAKALAPEIDWSPWT